MKSGSNISIWHARSVPRLTVARKQEPQYWLLSSAYWFEEMFVCGILTDASWEHSGQRTGECGEVCTVS